MARTILDSRQIPMFVPESSWLPPSVMDLPDPRGFTGLIGLDTETVDPHLVEKGPGFFRGDARCVGVSMYLAERAFYLPLFHPEDNGNVEEYLRYIRDVVRSTNDKVGANLLYDVESLFHLSKEWCDDGEDLQGRWLDIQTAQPLLDEMQHGGYSLDNLAKVWLGDQKDTFLLREALATYGLPKGGIGRLPARYVGPYAEHDARLPVQIFEKQRVEIKDQELETVFDVETRLHKVVWQMRKRGVPIDLEHLHTLKTRAERELKEVNDAIQAQMMYTVSGQLDWNKPKQMRNLVRQLGLDESTIPRTDTGALSFTNEWLLAQPYEVLKLVGKGRQIQKLKQDFIETYLDRHTDGILRSSFYALRRDGGGAVSGRFASQNVNLQQVPSRDPVWGSLLRSVFIPREGHRWLKNDYGSQEIRIAVHFAASTVDWKTGKILRGAEEMVRRYIEDIYLDLHQVCADIMGVSRSSAKAINLGILYGLGVNKLALQLGISVEEARALLNKHIAGVPFLRRLQEIATETADSRKYVKTILGRRRRFMSDPEKPGKVLNAYKALNAIVQGTAADQTKMAMVALYEEYGYVPLLTVHDELAYSVADDEQIKRCVQVMETCIQFNVPILVEPEVGPSWGETTIWKAA